MENTKLIKDYEQQQVLANSKCTQIDKQIDYYYYKGMMKNGMDRTALEEESAIIKQLKELTKIKNKLNFGDEQYIEFNNKLTALKDKLETMKNKFSKEFKR